MLLGGEQACTIYYTAILSLEPRRKFIVIQGVAWDLLEVAGAAPTRQFVFLFPLAVSFEVAIHFSGRQRETSSKHATNFFARRQRTEDVPEREFDDRESTVPNL